MNAETKAQDLAALDWALFRACIDAAVEDQRETLLTPDAMPSVWSEARLMFEQTQGRQPHFSWGDAFNNCRIGSARGKLPAPAPGLAAELKAEAAQEVG